MKSIPLYIINPIAYMLSCAFISALLTYPLHLYFHESVSFNAFIYRIAMALILLGLLIFAKRWHLERKQIGLQSGCLTRQIGLGFALGLLLLGTHAVFLVALKVRLVDPANLEFQNLLRWTYKGLLTGFSIAAIEEPLFRGYLLGYFQSKTNKAFAVFLCSFFFAGLHFLTTSIKPEFGETHWSSGLSMILDAVKNMADADLDSFLALFSAGAFLGCVRVLLPQSLGYCIGIHAGWVFVIKFTRYMSQEGPNPTIPHLVSHYDGIIGPLSSSWISLLILLMILYPRKSSRATDKRGSSQINNGLH